MEQELIVLESSEDVIPPKPLPAKLKRTTQKQDSSSSSASTINKSLKMNTRRMMTRRLATYSTIDDVGRGLTQNMTEDTEKSKAKEEDLKLPTKTLGCLRKKNWFRKISTAYYFSSITEVISILMILCFVFGSCFVDINTLEPRRGAFFTVSSATAKTFLLAHHLWFGSLLVTGLVSLGVYGENSFSYSLTNILEVPLVLVGLVDLKLLVCLQNLRLIRLIVRISVLKSMEFLREVLLLLRNSLLVVSLITIFSFLCTLFVGMFLNNFTVRTPS